jgi:hypothetical protein
MGTTLPAFWLGSSGSLLVPRSSQTTATPTATADYTGVSYPTLIPTPIVSPEETEWALLLESERKAVVKKRIKQSTVDKVAKEVRYGPNR